MTRITTPEYETDIEIAEVAHQAQRLYALADSLVARAQRIRDSAEQLVASAHIDRQGTFWPPHY